MRTKREQVAAHRFVVRRIVSAMVGGEPETLDLPMRRMAITATVGVVISGLIFAGFWVVGLVWPSGATSWKEDGAIVVEKETGSRYVYWDDELHPVRNFASALLITGEGDRSVHTVGQASLADTPRGRMLGIADAPDALPEPDQFISTPWHVCSAPAQHDPTQRESHVEVAASMDGGEPVGDGGVLISHDDQTYLVTDGVKHQTPQRALPALGAEPEQVVEVDEAVVNALPTGPDLSIDVPDAGDSGQEIDGEDHDVGDLFVNNDKHYVLLDDGLAPIGRLTAELIGTPPAELATAEVASRQSDVQLEPIGFPENPPELVTAGSDQGAVCAVYADGEIEAAVYPSVPDQLWDNPFAPPPGEADALETADRFGMPGGNAVLARAEPTPGASGGTVFLITDQGWKFGLTEEALNAFGYESAQPTPVPSGLTALLPTGPKLTQAAALQAEP